MRKEEMKTTASFETVESQDLGDESENLGPIQKPKSLTKIAYATIKALKRAYPSHLTGHFRTTSQRQQKRWSHLVCGSPQRCRWFKNWISLLR